MCVFRLLKYISTTEHVCHICTERLVFAAHFMCLCSSLVPGALSVQVYGIPSTPLICRYCKPGVEFRSMHTKRCQMCAPAGLLTCPARSTLLPCTSDLDVHCAALQHTVAISFCNNKFIDFGEQCDASAIHTPTASCCSDFICMLLDGY